MARPRAPELPRPYNSGHNCGHVVALKTPVTHPDSLRRGFGAWIFSPDRVGAVGVGAVAGYALGIIGLALGGHWLIDVTGRLVPSNYLGFWAAGKLALDGVAASAYDWTTIHATEATAVPGFTSTVPWLYPPVFLLLMAPMALLPYVASCVLWLAMTGATYLAAAYAIWPRSKLVILAAASPIVLVNVSETETGFLVAGLFGLSLAFMEKRPTIAGLCIGLLVVKPHFGLLFPLILIANRQWRVLSVAIVTVATLVGLTIALLGADVWKAFLEGGFRTVQAATGQAISRWADIQTCYSIVRFVGLSGAAAWVFHIAVATCVAGIMFELWRRSIAFNLKAAGMVIGVLIVTPYILMYDFVTLGIAVAYLAKEGVARGFAPGERYFLALVTLLPLYPLISDGGVPLMPFVLMVLLAHVILKAKFARRSIRS